MSSAIKRLSLNKEKLCLAVRRLDLRGRPRVPDDKRSSELVITGIGV